MHVARVLAVHAWTHLQFSLKTIIHVSHLLGLVVDFLCVMDESHTQSKQHVTSLRVLTLPARSCSWAWRISHLSPMTNTHRFIILISLSCSHRVNLPFTVFRCSCKFLLLVLQLYGVTLASPVRARFVCRCARFVCGMIVTRSSSRSSVWSWTSCSIAITWFWYASSFAYESTSFYRSTQQNTDSRSKPEPRPVLLCTEFLFVAALPSVWCIMYFSSQVKPWLTSLRNSWMSFRCWTNWLAATVSSLEIKNDWMEELYPPQHIFKSHSLSKVLK